MKKIDRGQIRFREYSITLLQPKDKLLLSLDCRWFEPTTEGQAPLIPWLQVVRAYDLSISSFNASIAVDLTRQLKDQLLL